MDDVIGLLGIALVVGLVVFIDVRRAELRHERRAQWAKAVAERRRVRQAQEDARTVAPGLFRCTACRKVAPVAAQIQMRDIIEAIQRELEPGAPIPITCDDCYEKITGDHPGPTPLRLMGGDHKGRGL